VTGLAANFSPIPLIAPPPLGREGNCFACGEFEGFDFRGIESKPTLSFDESSFCRIKFAAAIDGVTKGAEEFRVWPRKSHFGLRDAWYTYNRSDRQ
jgi:hypothetical protein